MADIAAFDTLATARKLKAAGINEAHAEAIAEAEAARAGRGELASKADLKAEIADLKADNARLESRLTWRLVGVAGVIVAAVGLTQLLG